ncbi:MAG: KdsC family phosphatase [Fusobacteriaceae bacterium]
MNIKKIVLDVDGTLTDGKLHIGNNGEELKSFSVKDGLAIVGAIQNGIDVCIVTGKKSQIVMNRAKELGITEIHQGISNKVEKLKEICENHGVSPENIAYMGDDLNDYSAIRFSGFTGAPSDACSDIIDIVDFISEKSGGDGAVREFIEIIMRKQKLWKNVVQKYSEMR